MGDSPPTVDTLAKGLHCNTPTENVTITMPPFFFCKDGQKDTQLGSPSIIMCLPPPCEKALGAKGDFTSLVCVNEQDLTLI